MNLHLPSLLDVHRRLAVWSDPFDNAVREEVGVALPLYELGQDHGTRVLIVVPNTWEARYRRAALERHLRDDGIRRAFPSLRLERVEHKTSARGGVLTVERPNLLRDPSLLIAAPGEPLAGYRFDLIVFEGLSFNGMPRRRKIAWCRHALSRLCVDGRVIGVDRPAKIDRQAGALEQLAVRGGWRCLEAGR